MGPTMFLMTATPIHGRYYFNDVGAYTRADQRYDVIIIFATRFLAKIFKASVSLQLLQSIDLKYGNGWQLA